MTGAQTLSVSQLTQLVNVALEAVAPEGVWVAGHIASISRPRTGHVYFELIDPAEQPGRNPKAKVAVTLFRDMKQDVNDAIKRYGNSMRMSEGVQIRIFGRLNYYAPQGQLQIVMSAIDPAYTLGRIVADRDLLLKKLADEGILRANKAHPVPAVPLRVGLVTSVGSAAHSDVMRILGDSSYGFTVMQADTAVQGPKAPMSVVAAIKAVAADCDVVLVVRGGGSATDLVAFDDEGVARAIALCERPVFTGIGHETDHSAGDAVAHTARPTPTAAAAAVVRIVDDWLQGLDATGQAIATEAGRSLTSAGNRLDRCGAATARLAFGAAQRADRGVEAAARRVVRAGMLVDREARSRWRRGVARLSAAAELGLRTAENRVATASAQTRSLDPARLLRRGWSITRRHDGALVRSVADVSSGERLETQVADGTITGTAD